MDGAVDVETMPHGSTSSIRVPRRSVVRGLGVGVLGAAGATTAGTVAAQSGNVTTLDIRETDDPTLPVADEVFVFAHGWYGSSAGPGQAADLADVLAAGGYEPDRTVALVYQADAANREGALEQARQAATEFAPVVQAFFDEGGGSLRLAGHSLGGRVVLDTLDLLEAGYVVDTVAPMGAAAVGSTVTEGGRWYQGIAERAAAVRNYHSLNDDLITGDFGSEDGTALGAEGAPDPSATPDTYTDVDVTDDVSGHGGYTSSSLLGQDLAEAIAAQGDGESNPCEEVDAARGAEVDGQWVCDVTDDGYYRDVNADGSVGQGDVAEFFTRQHRSAWKQPDLFDFSENGAVTHGDVVELFDYVALQ